MHHRPRPARPAVWRLAAGLGLAAAVLGSLHANERAKPMTTNPTAGSALQRAAAPPPIDAEAPAHLQTATFALG
jgi:hypothetical protein